jgi:hypothetical protein
MKAVCIRLLRSSGQARTRGRGDQEASIETASKSLED